MRDLPYLLFDVFTSEPFGCNPLAVVPDADGIPTELMQKIAAEFNYSETTFVFPAERGHTRKVRIFTPTTEVPFAGHPNVVTAFTLASIGELGEKIKREYNMGRTGLLLGIFKKNANSTNESLI